MSKLLKRLVVDTSVARASGMSKELGASQSRKLLQSILTEKHKLVINDIGLVEWKKHRSTFSNTWLTAMLSTNRVIEVKSGRREALKDTIINAAASEQDKEILAKDFFLIDQALDGDKIVFSLDDEIYQVLCLVLHQVPSIKKLVWINPRTCSYEFTKVLVDNNLLREHQLSP